MFNNDLYIEDLQCVASLDLPWEKMRNSSIMISGATGLVGSFLVDVIMFKNRNDNLNCTIYALGRNIEKAKARFFRYFEDDLFRFILCDINKDLNISIDGVGYVLHFASYTHPVAYATDPIGTITANIIGTNNMLKFSTQHKAKRFAFASSNEIYGENRGDVESFDEHYCGYIDCNTLRAGYPESKRCGEALCQAYIKQEGLDAVVLRFTRSYGPTMLMSDTKAISQFIKNGVQGEDIVLKSAGEQYYSYTYVADAVSGLLVALLKGKSGEAYNIADEKSDIKLKDLAGMIAKEAGKSVVYENPNDLEKTGYSVATKARINGGKLMELGWRAKYDINTGIVRTIELLKESQIG